jgi:ADP-heptose:LPS heptosyltransferase
LSLKGKCAPTLQENVVVRNSVLVDNSRPWGIGDTMCCMPAIQGLINDGKRVYFISKHPQWANLFQGFYIVPKVNSIRDELYAVYQPNLSYEIEMAMHRDKICHLTRQELYAHFCGTTAALPKLRPLPKAAVEFAEEFRDAVVIAPNVALPAYNSRTLSKPYWTNLIALLQQNNYKCLVTAGHAKDITGYNCGMAAGRTPQELAAMIQVSKVCISGDTSLPHLAGCMNRKAIVLTGATTHHVFGYASVKCLASQAPCAGCWWASKHYKPEICNNFCMAAHQIPLQQVVDTVKIWQN